MQATVQEHSWWMASDGNWYPPEQQPAVPSGETGPAATPPGAPQVPSRTVGFFGAVFVVVLTALVLGVGFGRGAGDPCAAVDLEQVRAITLVSERSVEAVDDATCVVRGTIGEHDPDDLFPASSISIVVTAHDGLSTEKQADIAEEFERTDVRGVAEGHEAWTFPDEAWVRSGEVWVHVTIDADNLVNHATDAALVADSVAGNR